MPSCHETGLVRVNRADVTLVSSVVPMVVVSTYAESWLPMTSVFVMSASAVEKAVPAHAVPWPMTSSMSIMAPVSVPEARLSKLNERLATRMAGSRQTRVLAKSSAENSRKAVW